MPTFRDVPGSGLTAEQQRILAAVVATPAVTDSLQRITDQMLEPMAPVLAAFRQRIFEAISTPVERAHTQHAERTRHLLEGVLQPEHNERSRHLIEGVLRPTANARVSVATAPNLQPVFDRIAKRQQDWAKALAVPLAQGIGSAAWTTTPGTADLFAAMQRMRVASPLQVELPDVAGWTRLANLFDEGRFDATTLEAAETQVAGDAEISEAIDETAEALAAQRPEWPAAQWRRVIVLEVWAMWVLALVALGVHVPSDFMAAITLAVGTAAKATTEGAGRWVDRRTITGQDGEDL